MNVPKLLRESTKEGMIGSEAVFIGKFVEQMISMLNPFITARRPDMIFIDKKHHECQIIDFAIPYDTRLDDKEVEKIEKYLDLARELKKV